MTYQTVIITPNYDIACSIDHGYSRSPHTKAFSVWATWHGRAERIVVLPMPHHYDEATRHNFEMALRECAQCRLSPDGEMIRL